MKIGPDLKAAKLTR